MMPGNVFSTVVEFAPFLSPRNVPNPVGVITDVEEGGAGLEDTSQGLQFQTWTATVDSIATGNIYLSAPNTPAILALTVPGITQLSFTFDQNMHPFFAYTQNGVAKFYWFDPTIPGFTITTLEAGALTPRCSLDDKRAFAINGGGTDILLFYLVGNTLLMRMQRDRYGIIYTMATNLQTRFLGNQVLQVGMNAVMRFQVEMTGAFYAVG